MSTEARQTASHPPRTNRRFFQRREVRSLAYVDLGRDNGGIVLNLSEGGVAIHSAVVLTDRRLPRVRFQLPQSTEWVEARGEVAWTSESKMQAGIQLVGLTDQARKQIREWVGVTMRPAAPQMPTDLGARRPLNSLHVKTLPTPAMPPDPPIPGTLRKAAPPSEQTLVKQNGNGRPTSPQVAPSPTSNGSKAPVSASVSASTPAVVQPSISGRERGAAAQLGFRLGQTAAQPKSRKAWLNLAAFGAFLVGMAALAFFAGLRSGSGDSRSLLSGLSRADARSDSASASESRNGISGANLGDGVSTGPSVGRITISSRLYVPVSIPTRSDDARADRLQVGALIYRPDPLYPANAQKQHTEGTVQLRATIGPSGSVENVTILGGPPALVDAASDAIRKWRFKPTQLDGKAIETQADIAIVFWLRPAASHTQSESK